MQETKLNEDNLRAAQLVMLKILKQVDQVCKKHNIPYWLDSGTLLGAVRHQGFIPWDDDVDICMMREDYDRFLKIALEALPPELLLQNIFTDKHCLYNYSKVRDTNSLFVTVEELNQAISYNQGIFIDIFPVDKLSKRGWIRYFWRRVFFKRLYEVCSLFAKYRQRKLKHPFHRNLVKNLLTICVKKLPEKLDFPNKRLAAAIEKGLRGLITVQSENSERYVLAYGVSLPFREVHSYHSVFPLKELIFEGETFSVPNDCHQYLCDLYGDTYMQWPKEENRKPGHGAYVITDLKQQSG
ncbi:MAG TPA: LicD family protein [Bacillota bacterium]|nr:LicD family protein [Bacillota bacterium]